jgi:hypothetical protein
MIGQSVIILVFVVFLGVIVLANAIRIVREYERLVVFRLGRLIGERGPGLVLLIPIVDQAIKVSIRTVTMDVPPQDIITKDNVSVKVNAVIYFKVMSSQDAIVKVENYLFATSQLAQTTLRSILGQQELDELLSEREKFNQALQQVIDRTTETWGVKVTNVEVKNVDLPQDMQRAIARQAEAERERRAKVINAEGEFQASERLFDAAEVMSGNPAALQLRYLQTLLEIGTNQNSTIVLPVPIDLIKPLMQSVENGNERREQARERDRLRAAEARPELGAEHEDELQLPSPDDARDLPAGEEDDTTG